MSSFGTTINSLANPTGSIRLGEQSMFDVNTRDPASIKRMNKAFDVYGNIAGEGNAAFVSGSGLGGTAAKASDAAFMERNLEDILQRASIGGGLDAEGRRDVIARELESSLQEEGHTLSEYMRNRIDGITKGLGEEELGDIEGNMDKIMDAYQHGNKKFIAGRITEGQTLESILKQFVENKETADLVVDDSRFMDSYDHLITLLVNQAEDDKNFRIPFEKGPIKVRSSNFNDLNVQLSNNWYRDEKN